MFLACDTCNGAEQPAQIRVVQSDIRLDELSQVDQQYVLREVFDESRYALVLINAPELANVSTVVVDLTDNEAFATRSNRARRNHGSKSWQGLSVRVFVSGGAGCRADSIPCPTEDEQPAMHQTIVASFTRADTGELVRIQPLIDDQSLHLLSIRDPTLYAGMTLADRQAHRAGFYGYLESHGIETVARMSECEVAKRAYDFFSSHCVVDATGQTFGPVDAIMSAHGFDIAALPRCVAPEPKKSRHKGGIFQDGVP